MSVKKHLHRLRIFWLFATNSKYDPDEASRKYSFIGWWRLAWRDAVLWTKDDWDWT